MLTLEVKWTMSVDEMEGLGPGAPRRNHAINEAIRLAARMGCNVMVALPGRSYRVTPEDSLGSVLERYEESPQRAREPGPIVAMGEAIHSGGPSFGQTWIGEPAENKGETVRITGTSGMRGYP